MTTSSGHLPLSDAYAQMCRNAGVRPHSFILSLIAEWDACVETEKSPALVPSESTRKLLTCPAVTHITLDSQYLGARQLLLLLHLIGVHSGGAYKSARDHCISTAVSTGGLNHRRIHCLMPRLDTVSLRNQCLAFSVPDTAPCNREDDRIGGTECLREVLGLLCFHPTLRVLDLSDNAIGPSLLPSLRRLIRCCPRLRQILLENTALATHEVADIEQELHQRLMRSPEGAASAQIEILGLDVSSISVDRVTEGVRCLPVTLSSKRSPHISRGSYATANAPSDADNCFPILSYRPRGAHDEEGHYLLEESCLAIVRGAFLDPQVAQRSVFRGAMPPAGLPGYLAHHGRPLSDHPSCASVLAQMRRSKLLLRIREVLFPTPPAKGEAERRGYSMAMEDRQEKQWLALLQKLSEFAVESSVSGRQPLYEAGQEAYWVTFVPRRSSVELDFPGDRVRYRWRLRDGGEFVGESAVLSDAVRDHTVRIPPRGDGELHTLWRVPLLVFRFLFHEPMRAISLPLLDMVPSLSEAPLAAALSLIWSLRPLTFNGSLPPPSEVEPPVCLSAEQLSSSVVLVTSGEFALLSPQAAPLVLGRGDVTAAEGTIKLWSAALREDDAAAGCESSSGAAGEKPRVDLSGLGKEAALREFRERKRMREGVVETQRVAEPCLTLKVGSTGATLCVADAPYFLSFAPVIQSTLMKNCCISVPAAPDH